jgi:hypothetical protein
MYASTFLEGIDSRNGEALPMLVIPAAQVESPCSMTKKQYKTRKLRVGTVKKSIAVMTSR